MITPTPKDGYSVDTVIVTDSNGHQIYVTDNGDGTYSYVQPDGAVEIKVTFKAQNDKAQNDKAPISNNEPSKATFSDVSAEAYYADAVSWAVANNITAGIGNNLFAPDMACTRAQIVSFLWRAAGAPEPTTSINPFTDVSENDYYFKAMLWAVENGITVGTSATTFSPEMTCTRAQAVNFIYRYEKSQGGGFSGAWMFRLPFSDVTAENYEAVAWCYMHKITGGISETAFAPNADCTRGQIVTFLYRYANVAD